MNIVWKKKCDIGIHDYNVEIDVTIWVDTNLGESIQLIRVQ